MRWCTYLLTYLHSWLGAYKSGNIFETVEDKAKVAINGLAYIKSLPSRARAFDFRQNV